MKRPSRTCEGPGRSDELCAAFESYYKAQGLWGIPSKGDLNYSVDLDLDLGIVEPGVAGPKRPQIASTCLTSVTRSVHF
jgi:aconitate hydratase